MQPTLVQYLSLAKVHSALAYYFDHKDEVWACIREDEAYVESMRGIVGSAVRTTSE